MVPFSKGLLVLCSLHLVGALFCNEMVDQANCGRSGPFHDLGTASAASSLTCTAKCEEYANANDAAGCCQFYRGNEWNEPLCAIRKGNDIRGDEDENYNAARCYKRLNCYRNTGVHGHNDHIYSFATLKECKAKCLEMGGKCGSLEFHSSGTSALKYCNIAEKTRDVTGWTGAGNDQGWTFCDALNAGKPSKSCGALEDGKQCGGGHHIVLSRFGDRETCSVLCAQHVAKKGGYGCCQHAAEDVYPPYRCWFYPSVSKLEKAVNSLGRGLFAKSAATCQDVSGEASTPHLTAQEAEDLSDREELERILYILEG